MSQETKSVQTVVDGDDNNIRRLMDPVGHGLGARVANDITSSVDIEENRDLETC